MKWFKWVLLTGLVALVTSILDCDALSLLVTYKMHSYIYASWERQVFSFIQTESLSFDLRLIEYTMCLSVVVCVCWQIGRRRDIFQSQNAVPSCCNVISLVERAKDCHSVVGN